MATERPDVSIIIVNWKSVEYLRKCLASIYGNGNGVSYEVLVLDNASWDGCGEMLMEHYPAVRFIQARYNTGFAKANNRCFDLSGGEYLLFLNPDTEIVGTAIQTMLDFLRRTPCAGLAGPKLLNSDLSIQTSCIQRFPTILNQAVDSKWLRRKFPRAAVWGTKPLADRVTEPVAVEVISGACMLVRRDVFTAVGGFNEDYFMYAEDVDLCYEAKRRGYGSYYVPTATVVHHGGRSSETSSENHFAAIMSRESLLRFMRTRRGRLYVSGYRCATAAAAAARLAMIAALMLATNRSRRETLTRTFSRWLSLLCWAFGSRRGIGQLAAKSTGTRIPAFKLGGHVSGSAVTDDKRI